jgi:hypothetical protein
MNDKIDRMNPDGPEAVNGQAARRNFIRNAGRAAVAAPAVALLLSPGSVGAVVHPPYQPFVPGNPPPPKKNILDP